MLQDRVRQADARQKGTVDVSRKFHNLGGLLRDLQAARAAGPTGDGDAYGLWTAFVDEVEFALEEIEGPGDADDAEDGDSDAQDELDEPEPGDGQGGIAEPRRHDAGGAHRSAPASVLDAVLDGLAGPERAAAIAEIDALRRDALAGTQPGAKRLVCIPAEAVKHGA